MWCAARGSTRSAAGRERSVMVGVVPGEQVRAPVVTQIAPYGVDVVGVVLSVVVLQQERGAGDAVVVAPPSLVGSRPPEHHLVETSIEHVPPAGLAVPARGAVEIAANQPFEQ